MHKNILKLLCNLTIDFQCMMCYTNYSKRKEIQVMMYQVQVGGAFYSVRGVRNGRCVVVADWGDTLPLETLFNGTFEACVAFCENAWREALADSF